MQRRAPLLINTEAIELWPAHLLRARSNLDARLLSQAQWVLRRKRDGRYLAAVTTHGVHSLVPRLPREPGAEDALALLDAAAARPFGAALQEQWLPLAGLQQRLQQLGLDPQRYADALGYTGVGPNSMDTVADRDFAVEFLSATAMLGVHLSRLCEEVVLWASTEFGWCRVGDAFSTGSSIMPQKRNPDVAELVRGKTGRLIGSLVTLLVTLKGLPLTYNRDLQEDKEPVFDAVDTLMLALPAVAGMMASLVFDRERLAGTAAGGFSLATDVAEALVVAGVPFRSAHERVGELVATCEGRGIDITDLTPDELVGTMPELDADQVSSLLDPMGAVHRRSAVQGPAPAAVERQLASLRERLG